MSTIIGLTEDKPVQKVWKDSYLWSFPYYMVGAAAAGLVNFLNRHVGWQSSLLVLPPIYLMYRSYRLYLGKLETEKKHAEQVSHLHLRTIEALALAIEAKDETTGEHLQRVRVYAMELAKELGLSEDEKEALQAASVLHDIGKLAVPEHIISKPGKLTPEEFEKMKIHPIVGAEILEQVRFPYPVVPIVRAHHEKWDGADIPTGWRARRFRSERGFSRQWIASMPWRPTDSIARRCRSIRRWQKSWPNRGRASILRLWQSGAGDTSNSKSWLPKSRYKRPRSCPQISRSNAVRHRRPVLRSPRSRFATDKI